MPPPSRKPGQTPKIISVASKASPQRQTASREDIDIDEPPIEESTDLVLIKSQPVEDDEVTGESQENLKRKATDDGDEGGGGGSGGKKSRSEDNVNPPIVSAKDIISQQQPVMRKAEPTRMIPFKDGPGNLPLFLTPAGLDSSEPNPDSAEATDNVCGKCTNCRRKPCAECSHCKRADYENCIDKYCLYQRDGLAQRQAMKEMYMLQRAKDAEAEATKQSEVMRQRQRTMEHSDQGGEQQRKQELRGRNDDRGVEFHVQKPGSTAPKRSVVIRPSDVRKSKTSPLKDQSSQNSIPQGDDETEEDDLEEESNLESIKNSDNMVFIVEDGRDYEDDQKQSVQDRVDKIMRETIGTTIGKPKLTPEEEATRILGPPGRKGKNNYIRQSGYVRQNKAYVYGASASCKKMRRCGECEGCMREDCGNCEACADKPKFGGPGRLKKACPQRKCLIVGKGAAKTKMVQIQ